jgi:hypothetical protein
VHATNGTSATQQVNDPDDEYPAHPSAMGARVPFAIKAVVSHQAEEWPTVGFAAMTMPVGSASCTAGAVDVLVMAGWSEPRTAELARRVEAGELPWR